MGQAKYNPTAMAAKNGEIEPKKKPIGKRESERQLHRILQEYVDAKYGLSLVPKY